MKCYLLLLFKSSIRSPYPQFYTSKEAPCFNRAVVNKRNRLSAGLSVFATLFFLILSAHSKAQITDVTTFPLNDYLYTTSASPYPLVNNDKLNAIDKSKFVNVMDYGAKGDGKTLDDNAIANAFKAAQYGVIFPSGKTFIVSKTLKVVLTHDLTVYAYGATIKMAAFSRYSFLSLEYLSGSYHNTVIWLGGTLNGNKNKQSWPGSPTGNNAWAEDHGRFVGVSFAEFALFKDVTVINTVVDGISIEACKLGVIADSKASGGAPLQYNQVQEQGTYFKFTRAGLKTCYFLNLTCDGGSIGTHVSYPENATMDNETVSVHVNCKFYNQVQNAIHIEDCYKNFFYNCTVGADTGYQYHPSVHLSNRTGIVSIKSCQFTNARVNFNQASSLKLGIIDSCQFVSEFKSFASTLTTFIEGRPTVCINSTFSGRTSSKYQGVLKNIRNCTFTNFDSLAVSGGYALDSCTFISGIKPASLAKGGFVLSSTFTDVQNTLYKSTPANEDWKKVYLSYIDILSDTKQYLGRITCGSNATQNKLASTTTAKAAALNSGDTNRHYGCFTCGIDSTKSKMSFITSGGAALSNNSTGLQSQQLRLYPNPTAEVLHVTLNDKIAGKTVLNIYDQQGRFVQTKTVYKNTSVLVETLNVNSLTAGAYVLQILNEQQPASMRFIIAR
ncbi:T9SS type A sorting domain-containing protein [Ilyomonas limi]|uniref:T9SS type A sorting domain-containing protein n=1 Tax=Ilyomonas limi TaxID=2575867 RepID=A0A4U3L8A4_9BACT|nr:T9SS type A sorting domain-containing protein [Ilyomonas limi]TKK70126.1 T9SS type A sorting domain-containing protein [Ilyomonas limi]